MCRNASFCAIVHFGNAVESGRRNMEKFHLRRTRRWNWKGGTGSSESVCKSGTVIDCRRPSKLYCQEAPSSKLHWSRGANIAMVQPIPVVKSTHPSRSRGYLNSSFLCCRWLCTPYALRRLAILQLTHPPIIARECCKTNPTKTLWLQSKKSRLCQYVL